MNNDLERSIRLLEDALSTPAKGLFRTSITSQKKEKPSMDLSLTLASHELQMLLESEGRSMYYDTMALLTEEDNTVAGSVIQSGSPWKSTMNNLYTEFADIFQTSSNGIEILDIAADLARCCSDALTVVQTLKSKVTISELPEEKWLENEQNNWRLLFVLYQDRLQVQNTVKDDFPEYVGTSEKNCVKYLFKRESLVRESQLVIDWLERNALERNDPILQDSDWTYSWEHTLHQLLAPESIAISSNVDIIKNIHPDSPQFENKSLHHLDVTNEKKLCQRIFTEIRCGNLEGAQELCSNTGHPWRAAMLEGWKLYHNPNVKDNYVEIEEDLDSPGCTKMDQGDVDSHYDDIEGNSSRDLWKLSALDYCKKTNLNIYEKAAVASLCGCLEAILPVCNTWEDYLWAYMKTMVDIRVESEIRDCIVKNYVPLPEEYWEQKLSLSEIFTILESSKNSTVCNESLEIDHIVQKHIILDEISKLITLLVQWSEDANVPTHSLRFFAHLILFFDNVGESSNRKSCEKVIEAYINRLSEMNETRLVALYVSKLSKRKQILIYAKHLETILENNQRKAALKYGEEYSLDVFAVTKRVVESISNQPSDIECPGNLQKKLTKADEIKISALDWLIFYEEQRAEALAQTNALIFKFLTLGKVEAAQLATNKIPQDSVEKILSEGEVDAEVNQTIKEFLSYKAYLDAQEAFNEWFKQYKNKPTPPASLPDNAQFTEKVAHEHRVSQYNAELERWKLTTSHSAKTAKTLLYNVLLFPQGWLAGGEEAAYLRSVCIPEVILLLYSILSESGLHEEAVRLADLIAAEKHALYKVYSKEKLGEILEKICESSVALLNAKKDPWGNPSTA
ncbi:nuclear pore complex protein Nup107 [Asbolus verrucosus]|uniref:Nuclear pore complex protein n=1 Tax=Asbolus verrucosus TaxID=1661398 RepID=A0A482VHC8_ASBVE|nr:nuclear pore complex protein Nup107 [Asbolus verrucosus]